MRVCVCEAEDAKQAVSHGVDGILVSNHGGRQLDGVSATVRASLVVIQYTQCSTSSIYMYNSRTQKFQHYLKGDILYYQV